MKRLLFTAFAALMLGGPALTAAEPAHDHATTSAPAAVHRCPMHPWIKSEKPGKCTVCGMDLVAASTAVAPEGVVALAPSIITAIGVETSVVSRQSLTRTVRVTGAIDDDDTRHRLLTAWAEGRVEKLHVNVVGASVKAGEPLLELYSPELQTAQREFVQLARAGELAASALPAARARLLRMGLADTQLTELLKAGEPPLVTTILAPDSGTVVAKSVYEGQWVKTGDKLLEIGDFSKMWFLFDTYEQDLPWLAVGQTVEITARSIPGEVITAPITFINPNLDEMTRTAKVRVVLPNPHVSASGTSHVLYHRVLAEGRVLVQSPAVLAAPRAAVLDRGTGPVAYIDRGEGHYEQRALSLGRRGDGLVEILSGLTEGDKVVTHGALLVDAQAQLANEASEHASGPAAPSPAMAAPSAPASSPAPATADLSALATAAIDSAAVLAADDYAAYQKLFPTLAAVAKNFPALPALELGTDLKSARRSFEPWSTAVADLLKPHRAHLGVKIFQCPMSPVLKKGRWVQRGEPLKNPFYGSAMADCGSEVP
ncbi:MAG: efflux RND transporter periplasmic adaptor subunit [Verrucomicrobia bacterium]|nr:efflux RND transporter periplasmic adaptor subunit [Verrucomicrobiota bacterium]